MDTASGKVLTVYRVINETDKDIYDYQSVKRVPDGHWNKFSNHIKFRDYIANKLKLETPDDWYGVSTASIRKLGGNGLLNLKYEGQTLLFLKAVFPEHTWYPWLFKNKLNNFWKEISMQILFIEWLGSRNGFVNKRDYYKLTQKIMKENKGGGLLSYYNGSVIQLLNAIISPPNEDEEWYPWLFHGGTSNSYWASTENRLKYAEWLYKHLEFSKKEDWYNVSQDTFRENYGSGLILNPRTYNGSHIKFLEDVYSEDTWYPWLFKQTTQGYWKNLNNRLRAMRWFQEKCDVKTQDDWYKITREDFRRNSLGGLVTHYYNDNLKYMIIELNPNMQFDISKFNIHKTEALFESYLKNHNIGYKSQYNVCKGKKNGWFKIDFYLFDFNICIELDGPQHFNQISNWLDPTIQKKRDVFKMIILSKKGIRCIRLLQDEVIGQTEHWLNTHVFPLIHNSKNTNPVYLTTLESNKYLYDEHKKLFRLGLIRNDELYNDDIIV
jgi:very-short-patch-repair endonuclease